MIETRLRLDEPFDVRLNTNVTPASCLLSIKICPSGSADVNSRVTLDSEALDECSAKSILHSKRVKEPCCFGTSHENVRGCPVQKCTSCIDTVDSVQADTRNQACMEY